MSKGIAFNSGEQHRKGGAKLRCVKLCSGKEERSKEQHRKSKEKNCVSRQRTAMATNSLDALDEKVMAMEWNRSDQIISAMD